MNSNQPFMPRFFDLAKPAILPPLEPMFAPAALVNRAFLHEAKANGVPLVIGLERENGVVSRFESMVFPTDHPQSGANLAYAERLMKFLLWQRNGYRVYVGGPRSIGEYFTRLLWAARHPPV